MQSVYSCSVSDSYVLITMPCYDSEEAYKWCHLHAQPHIFSAQLTQDIAAATSFVQVYPNATLPQLPQLSAFCPGVRSPLWHANSWECKGADTPCVNS